MPEKREGGACGQAATLADDCVGWLGRRRGMTSSASSRPPLLRVVGSCWVRGGGDSNLDQYLVGLGR